MGEKICVAKCSRIFLVVWLRESLDGLREQCCKSLGRGVAAITVGDVVVIEEDVVSRQ